jgi:hypothetical protein
VLISYLMLVLDGSIVITTLPRTKDELHFTSAGLSWVQSAYTLAFGGLLMLGARAGDILGRRRMFLAGLGLFTAASLASSTVGMGALVYGVVRSAGTGWSDAATLASVAAGLLSLAVFVQVERGAAQPIMPLRLFADRQRNAAYVARLLFLGAMMGFWFFTTQFLQGVLGFTAFQAGLAFLPMTLTNFAVAVAVPRLTRRYGNGPLLAGGLAVALAGMALLSRVSADTAYVTGVALPMLLIGIGQGAALSPLTVAAVSGVPAQDAGAAPGVVNVAHQFGGSLGLAVLVVFSTASGGLTEQAVLAHRIGNVLAASSAMLVLALAAVIGFIVAPGRRARAICIQPKKGQ